jgi:hypothetical protein
MICFCGPLLNSPTTIIDAAAAASSVVDSAHKCCLGSRLAALMRRWSLVVWEQRVDVSDRVDDDGRSFTWVATQEARMLT